MGLVTVRALILHATPYSETSKILRLYTEERGLRSVIAKGAQRPKSRYGGILEPFTEGAATFFLKENRDLHTLSGFELRRSRQALGRSLLGFAGASLLAELILRAGTEEPQPALFHAAVDALDAIAAAETDAVRERAVLAGAWRIVAELGFEPQLNACVTCTREIGPAEDVRFDAVAGGVACTRCRPMGRLLYAATRTEVRAMLSGDEPGALFSPGTHRALLRAFLNAQVAHDRPFRALEMYLQVPAGAEASDPDE